MGLLCIIRHVCRVHHISGGPPFGPAPTHRADGRVFLWAPFISIACMRYRRGRPDYGAFFHTSPVMNSVYTIVSGGPPYQVGPYAGPSRGVFYELRVARSDVVSLSLSRRNAASESAKKPWLVVRGSWLVKAHHHSEWAVVKYHSGPLGRPLRATSHEQLTTKKH